MKKFKIITLLLLAFVQLAVVVEAQINTVDGVAGEYELKSVTNPTFKIGYKNSATDHDIKINALTFKYEEGEFLDRWKSGDCIATRRKPWKSSPHIDFCIDEENLSYDDCCNMPQAEEINDYI